MLRHDGQLSLLDVLDAPDRPKLSPEDPRVRDWTHHGPACRLLRATARSIVLDCRALGVDPVPVLGPWRSVLRQAVHCDCRLNVVSAGVDVVRAWEHGARDRLRAARLQLEDDVERGRAHNCARGGVSKSRRGPTSNMLDTGRAAA